MTAAEKTTRTAKSQTAHYRFRRWVGAGIFLSIIVTLLGLSVSRLWQDSQALIAAPDRQAALKTGDGIVPEVLRQRINQALEQQNFAAANMAMLELQRIYPNDVFVQSQAIYGRIMQLRSNGGLTAEKRAGITRDIRQVIVRSGGNPVLLSRAEMMLALLITAVDARQAAPLPDFAAQEPSSEMSPNSPP